MRYPRGRAPSNRTAGVQGRADVQHDEDLPPSYAVAERGLSARERDDVGFIFKVDELKAVDARSRAHHVMFLLVF
eukprot:CAMPEP_0115872534 /NCGR_PEP_ID=MMETSP0287-20121206/23475_1 /TAXON_ID=412157 /ORGANISM="Chrysochromulina rotalis, Strain UIO044" /LENGTH=74 /DNA_ID=CAMNT_0003327457 /DNA_START=83 /DNA_END=307 /DNA_ORIENTATION=-